MSHRMANSLLIPFIFNDLASNKLHLPLGFRESGTTFSLPIQGAEKASRMSGPAQNRGKKIFQSVRESLEPFFGSD
jgi:hypothetical protein